MVGSISQEDIQSILHADRNDPFQILEYILRKVLGVFVRLFIPIFTLLRLLTPINLSNHDNGRIHSEGFYEVFIPNRSFSYLLRLTKNNGEIILTRDLFLSSSPHRSRYLSFQRGNPFGHL